MKKYALHPFAGIGFGPDGSSPNQIDASAMTWFHVDVWTPNGYAFDVKLVNDPTGYAVGVDREELRRGPPAPGSAWRSP